MNALSGLRVAPESHTATALSGKVTNEPSLHLLFCARARYVCRHSGVARVWRAVAQFIHSYRSYWSGESKEWSVSSAFIVIFINRLGKTHGWRLSSRRIPRVRITIGTNASPKNAIFRTELPG